MSGQTVTTDSSGTVVETITNEQSQNSVEISQNAKGQYTFSVKLYFNGEDQGVLDRATRLYDQLHEHFTNE
jgi:hypothetical protein